MSTSTRVPLLQLSLSNEPASTSSNHTRTGTRHGNSKLFLASTGNGSNSDSVKCDEATLGQVGAAAWNASSTRH